MRCWWLNHRVEAGGKREKEGKKERRKEGTDLISVVF
jgi:hypothetical protein